MLLLDIQLDMMQPFNSVCDYLTSQLKYDLIE